MAADSRPPSLAARGLSALWGAALLFALLNVAFMIRRAPILQAQGEQGDAHAVEAMAHRLQTVPIHARMLLLRSHSDPQHRDLAAVWFAFRLNYLIYPRHYTMAWETLPPDAERFDLVLAFGSACDHVPPPWRPLLRSGHAALFAPNGLSPTLTAKGQPPPSQGVSGFGLLWGLIATALVPVLGALLASRLCRRPPFASPWANLAMAHLLGAGALAWLATLGALLTGRLMVWPTYVLLALLAPGARRARSWIWSSPPQAPDAVEPRQKGQARPQEPEPTAPQHAPASLWSRRRQRAAVLLVALSLFALVQRAWLLGIGWDAYSIWQFKAQAFVREGSLGVVRDALYASYAHMDYPLLVPLQTWWTCRAAGGYNERWAQLIGLLFTLDLAAIFVAFAARWVSRERAFTGAALVLSLPLLTVHGVSGFADIEVACTLLAVGVLLADPDRGQFGLLAGLLAALVLVKNEGMLAAVMALTTLCLGRRGKEAFGAGMAAATGLLPWFLLKRRWRLQNDLLESGKKPHFTPGLLVWRLGVTLKAIVTTLARTGPNFPGWGLLLLLIGGGLIAFLRRRIAAATPLWTLCGLQLTGYIAIYLITPQPVISHLNSSLGRLLLHLAPTLILAALLSSFGSERDRA